MVGWWSVHQRLDRILRVSACRQLLGTAAAADMARPGPRSGSGWSASPGGGGSIDNKIEPIDNKIEQAMDLVKSHLLLAVREEVDVLKASISKLVDKISVLERENEVLKTNASPEVLAQLDVKLSQAGSTALAKAGWQQSQSAAATQAGH